MRKLWNLLISGMLLAAMAVSAGAYLASPARQILDELPDPNLPEAPEVVTVNEDGAQRTYIRVANPEAETDGEEFVYLPEDEVPLAGENGFGAESRSDLPGTPTDAGNGFPVVPVAGAAVAVWFLFVPKLFEVTTAGGTAVKKVTLFGKLASLFKNNK